MSHEVRPNSSYTSAALLLGVSVDAIQKFHNEMKAYDLAERLKSKIQKTAEKPSKNDKKD